MTLAEWSDRVQRREAWVRTAAWLVLAAGLLSFVVRGADGPADPRLATATRRPLDGFEQIAFRITAQNGAAFDWCALLAATEAAREQGLMDETDLRGFDAMVFRFDKPSEDEFYMFHTTLPLSIAWFDDHGTFVSSADMDPCLATDGDDCELFAAARPYLHAVEVEQGDLGHLGIGPGSTLSFPGGPCP